jgi:putative phage-type endonuclease
MIEIPCADESVWLAERHKDITSTEVAALFGCSPYCTEFELWHRKHEKDPVKWAGNERTQWGNRLEEAIARGAGEQLNKQVRPFKRYLRIDGNIGSSFDWITEDNELLECKNVDWLAFDKGWKEENGELVAPAHIELQVQHQLMVSGLKKAFICAFVGGNKLHILPREADHAVHEAMKAKIARFWYSQINDDPPVPTFPADAYTVPDILRNSTDGKLLSAPDLEEICAEYKKLSDEIVVLEVKKDVVKAKLLLAINDAEKATCGKFTISAKTTQDAVVPEHVRKGYRGFRITERKPRGKK